jgi:hypothetical protein
MGLFAQGTVQIKQSMSDYKLIINPATDYRVRHKAKDYTIFLDDTTNSQCFPVEAEFTADDSLKSFLAVAACNQLKIVIEICCDGKCHVIDLQVPAPTA